MSKPITVFLGPTVWISCKRIIKRQKIKEKVNTSTLSIWMKLCSLVYVIDLRACVKMLLLRAYRCQSAASVQTYVH